MGALLAVSAAGSARPWAGGSICARGRESRRLHPSRLACRRRRPQLVCQSQRREPRRLFAAEADGLQGLAQGPLRVPQVDLPRPQPAGKVSWYWNG